MRCLRNVIREFLKIQRVATQPWQILILWEKILGRLLVTPLSKSSIYYIDLNCKIIKGFVFNYNLIHHHQLILHHLTLHHLILHHLIHHQLIHYHTENRNFQSTFLDQEYHGNLNQIRLGRKLLHRFYMRRPNLIHICTLNLMHNLNYQLISTAYLMPVANSRKK